MKKAVINKDRRKYQRYSVKEGIYASINPPSLKIGQIFDISLGGLSFTYMNDDTSVAEILYPSVNIFSNAEKHFKDIPFQQVGDSQIKNNPSFCSLEIRKLRIQFGVLSDTQISNLYEFIEKNSSIDDFTGLY